ncbi:restriction endonuclease [Deinococcus sp.]|uniref:restriction endonuclease n=1 Tax=Deinococcus sp. TaxID=47478 RepID=UPI003B5CDC0E
MSNSEKGQAFEDFVARFFKLLEQLSKFGFEIEQREKVKDYEIDVVLKRSFVTIPLISGSVVEIVHRILIECKYWDNKIDQDIVIILDGKVKRNPGSSGIIITKSGFQSGAVREAKSCGIELLTAAELPNLINLIARSLASKIEETFYISENQRGEPFWCLIEGDDGSTFSGIRGIRADDGRRMAPLFFSKTHAEGFLKAFGDSQSLSTAVVRGLSQEHLKQFFVITCSMSDGFFLSMANPDGRFLNFGASQDMIIRDFYYINDPNEVIEAISKLRPLWGK